MKALVFAAGLGTRLKPLTDSMPKALVPVCGEPLLYHVLTRLRAAGYDEIAGNVHHFADQIRNYLSENDFGIPILVSDETDLLRETGGGIRHARPFLEGGDAPFLVHNVDILSDLDLGWFRRQTRPEALATLLVRERKTQRYFLFDRDMRLVGWTHIATGEVRSPYPALDPAQPAPNTPSTASVPGSSPSWMSGNWKRSGRRNAFSSKSKHDRYEIQHCLQLRQVPVHDGKVLL